METLANDNPNIRMITDILRTGSLIDRKVADVLRKFNITYIQLNILRMLEEVYPNTISVGEITKGLMFQTSDVTRLLDRLDKRDLIVRKICPNNRRKMDVGITEKGMKLISDSLPGISGELAKFYENRVTDDERDLLIDILKRFKD
jgi:DNA-binding MarR family transcriptional regulator